MKQVVGLAVAVALFCSSAAMAKELKSGLKKGASVGPFYVTKCAGAENDGTKIGKNLCYRCKNGSRPQVMVFTRSSDEKVVKLVKQLDKAIDKFEDQQLRAFVNMLGDSKDAATDEVKKLAAASKAKNVPFVVPNEYENGPENYGLNAKAEVTIIVANKGKVLATLAVSDADDLKPQAVMGKLKQLLN